MNDPDRSDLAGPREGDGELDRVDYSKMIPELEGLFSKYLGVLPEHWVLVVADGGNDRGIHSLCSPGMPMWQRYGLLQWDAQSWVPQPSYEVSWYDDDDDEDY